MMQDINILQQEAIALLQQLIATPSFSREEDKTADIIFNYLQQKGIAAQRINNNVFAVNQYFDASKPVVLLNSHHDTVKPNPQYTKDPFAPIIDEGKLYGLGSNDAGGCLVSLIAAFCFFYGQQGLAYNIVLAATAEEEISGTGGVELLLQHPDFLSATGQAAENAYHNWTAIVGEPTLLQMAVAERGLMVLDCTSHGKAGHAARGEGENAIYKAIKDIQWFNGFTFDKVSDLLGPSRMNVTVIETENKQHNVVPAVCKFVVDTRINELYSFEEALAIIRANVDCEIKPRSTRLRSTSIALDHPLVKAGLEMNKTYYGSPTTSDKALMSFQALKMGPGDSARSHTADEFIFIEEIHQGVRDYITILQKICK
ncbi:M20 family metallo-hydrolase [Terrimonas rubra]|uniref:M20 family metallo-hydrolase n=1 Tax=Terrimonas rubra TaxID=1035890 RepID=A0ABW6A2C2_9BACT